MKLVHITNKDVLKPGDILISLMFKSAVFITSCIPNTNLFTYVWLDDDGFKSQGSVLDFTGPAGNPKASTFLILKEEK